MEEFLLVLKSFAVGFFLGAIVTALKLPLPAPNNLAGVVGVIGVFAGYFIIKNFLS